MFKCKHFVSKPEDIVIHHDKDWIDWNWVKVIRVKFKGFCLKCDAFVQMEERHRSVALYEHFQFIHQQKSIDEIRKAKE